VWRWRINGKNRKKNIGMITSAGITKANSNIPEVVKEVLSMPETLS